MDDFRLNTIVVVSIAALTSDFSKWLKTNQHDYQLLYINKEEISNYELFDLHEGEIIIFVFKSSDSCSIITDKRVISISQNGNVNEMMLEHIQKVNKPKEYYMEKGEIKRHEPKKYIEIISSDKLINFYIDNLEVLYFTRILISNLFFITTKKQYYYLPSEFRNK